MKKFLLWIWIILDRLKIFFYFLDYEIVIVIGDKNGVLISVNVYVIIEGRIGVIFKFYFKDFIRINFR